MSKILTLAKEEIEGKNLDEFYAYVGRQLDDYTEEAFFDCCKINVSQSIQDCIYESYRGLHPELYERDQKEFDTKVTILLAIKGPKVSRSLNEYEVEIKDGFLC